MLRVLTVLCCLFPLFLFGQSTTGTQFWLGYMENLNLTFNDAPVFTIVVNTDAPTTGTIEVPTTGLSIPFSVDAGSTEIDLPAAIFYSEDSDEVDNKGILITAASPMTAQAYHYRAYFSESTSLLPESELGTEYLVTTITDPNGQFPSSLVIVATEDNTEVEITPTALTLGLFPAGNPYTVILNRGQNYQVQSLGDLAGTQVRSLTGAPVAVFSGSQQTNIGICSGGADSHVWDQSLPLDQWSDLYYFVPFSGQGVDEVRIVAAQDETDVFLDCELIATLNVGESFAAEVGAAGVISASGPISVTQYNQSQSCNPSNLGDPNGLSYFPAERVSTAVRWLASGRPNPLSEDGSYFLAHFVNVLAPTANTASIELDGSLLTGFSPFPADPNWSYVQLEIEPGEHFLESEAPFQAFSYGFGGFDAYTQNLGYTEVIPTDFACLQIEVDGLFCADSLLQFTYQSNLELVDFFWDFGDNTSSVLAEPQHAYSTEGTFTVTLTATDTQGTAVMASQEVTVVDCGDNPCDPEQVSILINTEGFNCVNQGIVFSFVADFEPTSATWAFGDGSEEVGGETVTHFYEIANIFTVSLTLTDAIGCSYTENLAITIENCDPCIGAGEQEVFFTGEACAGVPLVFSSSYVAGGIPLFEVGWSFSDGQFFSDLNPEVTFTDPGDYNVTFFAIDLAGCIYEGVLDFTLLDCGLPCTDLPPVFINFDEEVCVDEFVIFSVETSAELTGYQWGSLNQFSDDSAFIASFPAEGLYDVAFNATDAEGCTYEEIVTIAVVPCTEPCEDLEQTTFFTQGSLCVDSILQITPDFPGEAAAVVWTLPDGDTRTDLILDELQFSSPGQYEIGFAVTRTDSCFYETTIPVAIVDCVDPCEDLPVLELGFEQFPCEQEVVSFSLLTTANLTEAIWLLNGQEVNQGLSWEWDVGFPGTYFVQVLATDDNGCSYEVLEEVFVTECVPSQGCQLMIPNIFSPNQDGTNDHFRAFYAEECQPDLFNLKVFNRWGVLVYESTDPTQAWDGTVNGKPHPTAVLVYWCQYRFSGRDEEELKGDVTLVR